MNLTKPNEPTALQKRVARLIRNIAFDEGNDRGTQAARRALDGSSREAELIAEFGKSNAEEAARVILSWHEAPRW